MIYRTEKDFAPESIERASNTLYDAIIIGGGTSGLVSALTLIEQGKKVALFEAGGFSLFTHISNTELRFQREVLDSVRSSFQYTQRLNDGSNFGPNFSCLGGRGLFWNGASPRFQPHDFNDWPITYEELIPYYEWAEMQFRVSHEYGNSELARKTIATLRNKLKLNAVPAPFALSDNKMYNGMLPSGIASGLSIFLRNNSSKERKELIDVFTNSFVSSINFSSSNKADGVNVIVNKKQKCLFRARVVIIACGGIESIKLLLNSGVQDPYNRIGKGIQEHIFYRTFWDGTKFFNEGKKDAATLFIPSLTQDTEQIEIHAPGRYLFATDSEQIWKPNNSELYDVMIRSFAATEKVENNYFESGHPELGNSLIRFSYSSRDVETMKQMKSKVISIGDALEMKLNEERFASKGGSYHESGGLDMGNDIKSSVTDKFGRIHTTDNVYVIDASVFTKIGATNPHLTLAALSRKQTLNISKI